MSKVIVDTDPGVDDALALLYLSQRDVSVEAITTVAGNTTLENTLRNSNYLTDILDIDAPVYRGAEKPLARKLQTAASHGKAGLGDVKPDKSCEKSRGEAVSKLQDSAGNDTDLLVLGPPTNLALALDRNSNLLEEYRSVTIMGGAVNTYGNVNRVAEFNFWVDPEAADRVLQASGKKSLVPVNVCREVTLDSTIIENLEPLLQDIVRPYTSYYQEKEDSGGVMYDPLAAVLALNPEWGDTEQMDLAVETRGDYTRGMLVPEERNGKQEPNTMVYREVNTEKVKEQFKTALKPRKENSGREK